MVDDNHEQRCPIRKEHLRNCGLWRWNQIFSPLHNTKCQSTRKNSWQLTSHFRSLHSFFGKRPSQQLSQQILNHLHVSFGQKLFHRHYGMRAIMCCILISKQDALPVQSTQLLIFFLTGT